MCKSKCSYMIDRLKKFFYIIAHKPIIYHFRIYKFLQSSNPIYVYIYINISGFVFVVVRKKICNKRVINYTKLEI